MFFKLIKKIFGLVGLKLIDKNLIKNDRLIGQIGRDNNIK